MGVPAHHGLILAAILFCYWAGWRHGKTQCVVHAHEFGDYDELSCPCLCGGGNMWARQMVRLCLCFILTLAAAEAAIGLAMLCNFIIVLEVLMSITPVN